MVKFFRTSYRTLRRTVLMTTKVPALIALVVVAILGLFTDHQNALISRQALRSDVVTQVSLLRAKLEGNIYANIQLVRGLVATLSVEPDMDEKRFERLAATLFSEKSQLRNIAVAPNLVVKLVYPLAGNEKVLGLDLSKDGEQRETAFRARDTGELVLAGPVKLVQGGTGFIGRFPVFVYRAGNERNFWGVVSAVVDAEKLYRDSGLLDSNLPIDIAITGKDARGKAGERFFGSAAVVTNNPVTADVILPSGSWQIAAVPKGGWTTASANAWLFRFLMMVAGALVVIPILIAGRLVEERQKHYRQLRRNEKKLSQLSRRLELALDASQIGVWEHNLDTNELLWDDRVNELYGKPVDGKLRGPSDWIGAIHPDDAEQAQKDFDEAVANRGAYSSEYRVVLPDGTIRHIRTRATVFQDGSDAPRMIGAEWDVTADIALRKDLERAKTLAETRNMQLEAARTRIEHIALHDSLTGLPNRRYLDEMLEGLAPGDDESNSIALLHIDLDRFKEINDTLGHAAGDAMLVHAAKVLKANIRKTDFVARTGGDEFVVVCTSDGTQERMASLAERIIRRMQRPVSYQGTECRFGVSVGITSETGKIVDPKRLLVNADIALYRAKSRGRNRYEFFTETLQEEIVNTKRLADEILKGLEANEFLAYYQPQFDARTLRIVGVEALVRWQHPQHGLMMPEMFLRVAEELNVVPAIDRLVLNQALRQYADWNAAGLLIPRVSVNVSSKRLEDEELIPSIREMGIQPGTVSFELVESIFLDESDDLVASNIRQLKDLGIDIEIDDFGTGYASILSLLKLRPRRLKIDRQLVQPIVRSETQKQLVGSIIDIGRSLGIEVVAEGVETLKHVRILRELGCDILQGYVFSGAIAAAEFEQFVRARSRRAAS